MAGEQSVLEVFVGQLQNLGWTDGQNIALEWRFADGQPDRLPQLAADLVQALVEVMVTSGAAAAVPAHQQTTRIPIVLVSVSDPTVLDLVTNLAHPAGNVTGTALGIDTINIKSVELLRTVLPQLSRLAIFADPSVPAYTSIALPTARAAQAQGLQAQVLDADKLEDLDAAFDAAQAWGAEALLIAGGSPYLGAVNTRIGELAAERHLPTMFGQEEGVTEGSGLMSFSRDSPAEWRQAAEYVDQLLRGASPSDLPVQEPRKWDFVVNVKVAKALGISFPPDAAAQVTQWIQ
jgi:putative ABC transport system substrate-binding protein